NHGARGRGDRARPRGVQPPRRVRTAQEPRLDRPAAHPGGPFDRARPTPRGLEAATARAVPEEIARRRARAPPVLPALALTLASPGARAAVVGRGVAEAARADGAARVVVAFRRPAVPEDATVQSLLRAASAKRASLARLPSGAFQPAFDWPLLAAAAGLL